VTNGYVLTFDGESSATAVPELVAQRIRRPFMGDVRDQYVEVPGRESAWLFSQAAGDASLEVDCTLIGDSRAERRAAVRSLASWSASSDRAPLIIDDEPDRMWYAKLESSPNVDEALRLGRLTLSFRCEPYAVAVNTSEVSASAFPFVFNAPGDADIAMYQVIEVTTTAPAASGFEIVVNGVAIGTREVLAAGVTRTVSALSATITTGANANAELAANRYVAGTPLAMALAEGDFALLEPGSNTIAVTRGSVSVRVVWRRRYA